VARCKSPLCADFDELFILPPPPDKLPEIRIVTPMPGKMERITVAPKGG